MRGTGSSFMNLPVNWPQPSHTHLYVLLLLLLTDRPLDFSAHLLQAEHESPVMSACLASNGLAAVVGCKDGVVGVLDIMSHRYVTLMRSHGGPITGVAVHHDRWGWQWIGIMV